MTKTHKTHAPAAPAANEHPLDEAVARALRDNLGPLQHTVEELQHAYADLISACASSRASNALPAMLRAQAAAASLAAGLGVLSNFVTIALQPRDHDSGGVHAAARMIAATVAAAPAPATSREEEIEEEWEAEEAAITEEIVADEAVAIEPPVEELNEAPAEVAAPVEREAPAFDVASLSAEIQELHRRAKRVAKVAMQDIKMLRPKDVRLARENKDICVRLRDDLDKARKEYDRRFKAILDQPVDYFHDWMVAILADGDPEALGEYPYPSPVLRH